MKKNGYQTSRTLAIVTALAAMCCASIGYYYNHGVLRRPAFHAYHTGFMMKANSI